MGENHFDSSAAADRAPVRVTQPTRPNIGYQVRARPPPGGAVVGCAEDTTTTTSSVAVLLRKQRKCFVQKKTKKKNRPNGWLQPPLPSLRTGHGLATPDSSAGPNPGRVSKDSLSTVTLTVATTTLLQ